MVLVIDTSSARSALVLLSGSGEVVGEVVESSGRDLDLPGLVEELVDPARLERVVVATGPGSFTGLRMGVSYALGLAMGREIPLFGLSTLELAAARSQVPATGLAEAGRGRVYFLAPGGEAAVGGPQEVPRFHPACGWLREPTRAALVAAGVELLEEDGLRPFAVAVRDRLSKARELGYDRVALEYLHSFGALL